MNDESKVIKADEWSDMTFEQLMEQKAILTERYLLARKLTPSMIPQIENGLDLLEEHIMSKF